MCGGSMPAGGMPVVCVVAWRRVSAAFGGAWAFVSGCWVVVLLRWALFPRALSAFGRRV